MMRLVTIFALVMASAVAGRSGTRPPTRPPTPKPSNSPTALPTHSPTHPPTHSPTRYPTKPPTPSPTFPPSPSPTKLPSPSPTQSPTASPTKPPSPSPSASPSESPSVSPTQPPSASPTQPPSASPTQPPTASPTLAPTASPTFAPTAAPTLAPTTAPTLPPTAAPTPSPTAVPTSAPTSSPTLPPNPIQRVVIVSVDGLQASDLRVVAASLDLYPNFKYFMSTGVTYQRNEGPAPSDSWPGSAAYITGGSPGTTGFWYDNAYDRTLVPGSVSDTDCLGSATGFVCTPGMTPTGAAIKWGECMDTPNPPASQDPTIFRTKYVANPLSYPRDPVTCDPVPPNKWILVNTIYEVVKNSTKGWTAFCDKHPTYDYVKGPSGTGLDDGFFPEGNSFDSKNATIAKLYDDYKTTAFVNWTNGFNYDGTKSKGGPPILSHIHYVVVNAVEKRKGTGFNTTNTTQGSFTAPLAGAFQTMDANLGKIKAALDANGLTSSTLVIITSKHGQSPIDGNTLVQPGTNTPGDVLANDPFCGQYFVKAVQDTSSLIWLNNNSAYVVSQCRAVLEANIKKLGLFKIMAGPIEQMSLGQPNPARNPDIISLPYPGTVYTTVGGAKVMEHGGFGFEDINTALIVSNPTVAGSLVGQYFYGATQSTQIAATVLAQLSIDPKKLQAVVIEGVTPLPGLVYPVIYR